MPRRTAEEALNQSILDHHIRQIEQTACSDESKRLMIAAHLADCALATALPRSRGALVLRHRRAVQALIRHRDRLRQECQENTRRLARMRFLEDPETAGEA